MTLEAAKVRSRRWRGQTKKTGPARQGRDRLSFPYGDFGLVRRIALPRIALSRPLSSRLAHYPGQADLSVVASAESRAAFATGPREPRSEIRMPPATQAFRR